MSVAIGRAKLLGAMKELEERWVRIKERWDDPVSAELEAGFIEPTKAKIRAAVTAMERANEVVIRARRECD